MPSALEQRVERRALVAHALLDVADAELRCTPVDRGRAAAGDDRELDARRRTATSPEPSRTSKTLSSSPSGAR